MTVKELALGAFEYFYPRLKTIMFEFSRISKVAVASLSVFLLVACSGTDEKTGSDPGGSDVSEAPDANVDPDPDSEQPPETQDVDGSEEPDDTTEEQPREDASTDDPVDDTDAPDPRDVEETEDDPDTSFEFDTSDGDGSEDGESAETFALTRISPQRGPTGGGTKFVIEGEQFTPRTRVYFGGREADVELSNGRLVGETPDVDLAQSVTVKAVDPENGRDALVDAFTFVEKLGIKSVTPNRISSEGGIQLTIRGEGFDQQTRFTVGGIAAVNTEVVNADLARTTAPAHEPGTFSVRAINEDETVELDDGLTYFEAPQIDYVEPAVGEANADNSAVIHGEGFGATDSVTFGSAKATVDKVQNGDTEMRVEIPPRAPGLVDVAVQRPNGLSSILSDGYYFRDGDEFSLQRIRPIKGVASGGDEIRLIGPGIGAAGTDIQFGGKQVSSSDVVERGTGYIVVESPAHSVGLVDVSVGNGSKTSAITDGYEYVENLAIDSVSPEEADISQLGQATITGDGFENVQRVKFGESAASFTVVDNSTIEVDIPAHPSGTVDVSVHRGDIERRLDDAFEYTQPLQVDGFSPIRGSVAGGTRVVFRGRGFTDDVTIKFDGKKLKKVDKIDPYTVAGKTPSHGAGRVEVTVEQRQNTQRLKQEFTYFNPGSRSGGVWGGPIQGSVNVSVFSRGGRPIEDAYVQLSTNKNTPYSGKTDSDGTVTLSGPEVYGEQTVTAAAPGFSTSSIQRVDARNVTLFLSPEPSPGQPPPGPPTATFKGKLTGLDKLFEPGPNEKLMAVVQTTQRDLFTPNPNPGNGNVLFADGQYELNSRIGDLALVALGGLYNNETDTFTPMKMGVKRYQVASNGETYDVDIELDTRLNKSVTVKLPGAPSHPNGPNINRVQPYIDFGFEGVFTGLPAMEGQAERLTGDHFAELDGQLSDVSYIFKGGAYTGQNAPSSIAYRRDVEDISSVIKMPELPAIPRVQTPQSGQSPTDGLVQFTPSTVNRPDYYYLKVMTFQRATKWEGFLPGSATSFRFPEFPSFSNLPPDKRPAPYPGGSYILVMIGIEMDNANYNQLAFSDLSQDKWDAYSTWTQLITF